jgi:hypothetical protein
MSLTTSYIGQAQVLVDATYTHRWYDAVGPYVNKVCEDFVQTPYIAASSIGSVTTTLVNASTHALVAGALGGAMLITTAGANLDGVNMQWLGEAFLPTANNEIYFGCRFQVNEATNSVFLIGLAITDTTADIAVQEGIYFRKLAATTACNFVVESNNVETATAAFTVAAATNYIVEWRWNGTNLYFYVDGVYVGAPVLTNIPTAEYMTPTITYHTGEIAAHTMTVDWIRCIQTVG